eukprot:357457_1
MGLVLDCNCCTTGLFFSEEDSNMDVDAKKFHKNRKQKQRNDLQFQMIELKDEKYKNKCKSLLLDVFIRNKFDTLHYDLQNKQVFKTYIDYYLSKSIQIDNSIKSFIAINKQNKKEVVGVLICDNYSNEMDKKTINNLIKKYN